jgi:hypothetical protein
MSHVAIRLQSTVELYQDQSNFFGCQDTSHRHSILRNSLNTLFSHFAGKVKILKLCCSIDNLSIVGYVQKYPGSPYFVFGNM